MSEGIGYLLGGLWAGIVLGIALGLWSQSAANDSWEDGAIGVYEKTAVCEQALDEWVCKRD